MFSDLPIASTVSMVSKYKEVNTTHQTMDSGCFSECKPERGWVELTGWTRWVGRGYPPCPELQTAWKQCKHDSRFSAASQAQRQGSGVCWLLSYGSQWARLRLTSLELPCWVSTEAPGQTLLGKGMAGAKGNRGHPGWGPACSLHSPHHTEVHSACPETWPCENYDRSRKGFEWSRIIPVLKLC